MADDASVKFLYGTRGGRVLLRIILACRVPKLLGFYLRTPLSCPLIPWFIKKNAVPMDEFKGQTYKSFNDFFTRKKETTFDTEKTHLISPCDSLLSVYDITDSSTFHIKGYDYTISDFLQNPELERQYAGGTCLVFRLCATDYHRYCYIDDGYQGQNHYIEGSLYSVQPLACRNFRVYTKNRRSWTVLQTEHFGNVAQIEIGAFSVGGIKNLYHDAGFKKGQEKGYFDLHGSTIVLLFEKGRIQLLRNITDALAADAAAEYRVTSGMYIGDAAAQE